MKKNKEISKQVRSAIVQAYVREHPVILEELIKAHGINQQYEMIIHLNVTKFLINTTILDSLLSGNHDFIDKVFIDLNPAILKDVSYYELLLAKGAIAPFYELNYNRVVWYKTKISAQTKSQYFTNKILNTIIKGEILSPSTEMHCYTNVRSNKYFKLYNKSSIIFNRLKYLILDGESKDHEGPINAFDLLIVEFKAVGIFDNLISNIRKNELALLKDESFNIKKLLDFKKIVFDQLSAFGNIYCSLNFESNFNKNLHFMRLIKDKINSENNEQEDSGDFKLLALLKRIYEDKPVISASLINIYLPNLKIDKIIKTINDNFFKFRWGIKENSLLPTEIQVQIATYITDSFAEELAKYFPYQNYFNGEEYNASFTGGRSIICSKHNYSHDDFLI